MVKFIYTILFVALLGLPQAYAKKVPKKFITLTIGLTQDENLSFIPKGVQFKGTYRTVTKVFLARGLKMLRFSPYKVGTATLTLHDQNERKIFEYIITVRKSSLQKVAREIRALLGEIEGITVKIINNKVVVDGEILLPRDMNRIYSVVSQYGKQASSIVSLSPLAQRKIAELIERDINNPEVHVRAVNSKFILEGVANDPSEKQRAEIIAKTYVPDVIIEAAEQGGIIKKRKVDAVINLLTVKPAPEARPGKIIQVVVHYVELSKDYERGFRFQWTPTIEDGSKMRIQQGGNGVSPGGVVSSLTAVVSNLLPRLNWAKQH
jgi:pilus assembly protein CpaC